MIIGIPKEIQEDESRVAISPKIVKKYLLLDHKIKGNPYVNQIPGLFEICVKYNNIIVKFRHGLLYFIFPNWWCTMGLFTLERLKKEVRKC